MSQEWNVFYFWKFYWEQKMLQGHFPRGYKQGCRSHGFFYSKSGWLDQSCGWYLFIIFLNYESNNNDGGASREQNWLWGVCVGSE